MARRPMREKKTEAISLLWAWLLSGDVEPCHGDCAFPQTEAQASRGMLTSRKDTRAYG